MPIKNGKQYIQSINGLRPNILYRGYQITGDISDHSAFRGLIESQAALYDLQCQTDFLDKMTYPSPTSKEPVGLSFLQPKTKEDLTRRRIMMSAWAKQHHGFMGRSPDYMNTGIMGYASAADVLAERNPEYADNLKQYYLYCREHDVTLSHAFSQPSSSRLSILYDPVEDSIGAKVHEINQDGMVVSGAFMLATQGVTAEEIFIFPTPVPTYDGEDSPYIFSFAVPNNLPGMQFVCRESYVSGGSASDYPLSSRFEEMDTLVIFDHVVVPRNRIFLYGDLDTAKTFTVEGKFSAHVSHQVLCRYIAKTEFFLGLVQLMEKLNGPTASPMYEQIAELTTILEILKSFLVSAEELATPDRWGNLVPHRNTTLAANAYFPKVYPRMMEIVQTLSSSKLIMLPSEEDFKSQCGENLDKYLKLYDTSGLDVVRVYRLAWELSASSFAGRQAQYERFFFGDSGALAERLYVQYQNREQFLDDVINFLRISLPDN